MKGCGPGLSGLAPPLSERLAPASGPPVLKASTAPVTVAEDEKGQT